MVPQESLALYVHIPFCKKKCPYCDFYSIAINETDSLFDAYVDALIKELNYYSNKPEWQNKRIESIYFGGGTPSLLTPNHTEKILTAVKDTYPLSIDAEISIEANPISVSVSTTTNRFQDLKSLGFNRISIGVQSFADQKLQFLGRIHDAHEGRQAINLAYSAGFSNVSIDLIFGAPEETILDWENDINEALKFNPQHISAYSLTIEPGSEFYKLQNSGHKITANDDAMAGMYRCSQQLLQENGFIHYEISNFAKPSFECKHNMSYWTYKDYLGLGPGSHSFIQTDQSEYGMRWSNIRDVKEYLRMVKDNGNAQDRSETLSKEEARLEFFLLALRQKSGINKEQYQKRFHENFDERYDRIITKLTSEDLATNDKTLLALTEKGFLLSDSVIAEFVDA